MSDFSFELIHFATDFKFTEMYESYNKLKRVNTTEFTTIQGKTRKISLYQAILFETK